MRRQISVAFARLAWSIVLCTQPAALAQTCSSDKPLNGIVLDPSGGVVAGATVTLAGSKTAERVTGKDGSFSFDCAGQTYRLIVRAGGFSEREVSGRGRPVVKVQLSVAELKQVVDVAEDSQDAASRDESWDSVKLDSKAVAAMADDPDDFKRQLQALAAASGGTPGQAAIIVDGFQNGGLIPPKSAIAAVLINPDLYSAEFARPPYQGGRIEILTKPGGAPEGEVFFSDGPSFASANNPFSQSSTPASSRRFGFELGGPIQPNKSDYFVAFERREINEYSVVNAITLNSDLIPSPLHQSVPFPRDLWIGNARTGWQLGPKHTLVISLGANVNSTQNEGVGGLVLAQAGFNATTTEYDLRFSETDVLSANLLHQARFSLTRKNTDKDPLSTDPSINVAGAFIGGGAAGGPSLNREHDSEFDDSVSWVHGRHTLKAGVNVLGFKFDNSDLTLFNGSFLFGSASALDQYRSALLNLPGGTPTSFESIRGTPTYEFSQWQTALYLQDQWNVRRGLSLSLGLRYSLETSPGSYGNFAPRIGLAFSPGHKQLWVLRLRSGIFYSPVDPGVVALAARLDGQARTDTLIYSPSFEAPLSLAAGAVAVQNVRRLAAGLGQTVSYQSQVSVERQLPQHWQAQVSLSYAESWNALRTRNINAPVLDSAAAIANPLLAARPFGPGLNIFQFEPSGMLRGPVLFASLSQHSYKSFGVFFGYLYSNLRTNADSPLYSPQSSYSDAGDVTRASWEPSHQAFAVGQIALPKGVSLSNQLTLTSGTPYDVVTGADNNGDGLFNDRPSIASQPGQGVYSSPFGLLNVNGVNGTLPRNVGSMPALVHLDGNLSRTFQLHGRGLSADRRQSLTVNLRVANVLNHTNVTSVGNIIGSPTFGQPIAAEAARRVEFGLRFKF